MAKQKRVTQNRNPQTGRFTRSGGMFGDYDFSALLPGAETHSTRTRAGTRTRATRQPRW